MNFRVLWIAAPLCLLGLLLRGEPSAPVAASRAYDYKVMALAELVGDSPQAMKKIEEMTVHSSVGNGADERRTDLDAADYQAAIDHWTALGWEPVTVNRSNYWVFRRARR